MTETIQKKQLRTRLILTVVPLCILLVAYAIWIVRHVSVGTPALLSAALAMFLFALLYIRFVPQWIDDWSCEAEPDLRGPIGKRSGRKRRLHPFFSILGALVLFRAALFAAAYWIVLRENGYQGGAVDLLGIWNQVGSDSRHYLYLAENWYASTGSEALLIVFFPLYPILVRLFHFIFNNYLVSGLFVSNVCAVLAGYLFYELALLDMDRKSAVRSLKFLCILPAALLLSAPMSDSLFLLLSLGCMYLIRKKQFALAGIVGFFAAFTRMPGVILLVPAVFELASEILRDIRHEERGSRFLWHCIGNAASLLLIPLGLCLYLYINFYVTGNALQFTVVQSEHWGQNLNWFFNTAAYQADHAAQCIANREFTTLIGLWAPNILFFFGALSLVAGAQNKLRPSYVAYFVAYFVATMGATWLLSAPRYLVVCFPVAMALGKLTEKKWANILATALCLAGLCVYLYAFVQQWYVY